jgi:ABC-2 type transport system ATP-binding protein
MEKEILVELNNVSKIIKGEWKVKRVDLNINRGESIGIIGQRDSGKDILTALIENKLKPTGGEIEYFFNRQKLLESVGVQISNKSWPMGFKTKDVVRLYRDIYGITDEEWMTLLIDVFELKQIWNDELINISPSWAQIVSLFVAVIHRPELLILEDITSQISLDLRFQLIGFLKDYCKTTSASLIFISPEEFVFNELCDRLIAMNKGQICYDELKSDWKAGDTFENVTEKIIKKIKDKEISSEDKVLLTTVAKFHAESEKITNVIDYYSEHHMKLGRDKIEKWNYRFIIELLNAKLFVHYVENEMRKLIKGDLTTSEFKQVQSAMLRMKKVLFEIYDAFKKHKDFFMDEPSRKKLYMSLEKFIKYLKDDIIPFVKNKQLLATANETTIKLTKFERKKLRQMKRKYISEEIKILRQEQKILKRNTSQF